MGRIDQYLQRYAEPDSNLTLNGSWTHSLVIPACDEGEAFVARLKTLDATTECDALLVIVVINGREDADPVIHQQNQRWNPIFLSARDRILTRFDDCIYPCGIVTVGAGL